MTLSTPASFVAENGPIYAGSIPSAQARTRIFPSSKPAWRPSIATSPRPADAASRTSASFSTQPAAPARAAATPSLRALRSRSTPWNASWAGPAAPLGSRTASQDAITSDQSAAAIRAAAKRHGRPHPDQHRGRRPRRTASLRRRSTRKPTALAAIGRRRSCPLSHSCSPCATTAPPPLRGFPSPPAPPDRPPQGSRRPAGAAGGSRRRPRRLLARWLGLESYVQTEAIR